MPPPTRQPVPTRNPGRAPRVAATCIALSFMLALVLVIDPLIPREGWAAAALAKRQAMLVWVYGAALAILQLVAGGALLAWWRSR